MLSITFRYSRPNILLEKGPSRQSEKKFKTILKTLRRKVRNQKTHIYQEIQIRDHKLYELKTLIWMDVEIKIK